MMLICYIEYTDKLLAEPKGLACQATQWVWVAASLTIVPAKEGARDLSHMHVQLTIRMQPS